MSSHPVPEKLSADDLLSLCIVIGDRHENVIALLNDYSLFELVHFTGSVISISFLLILQIGLEYVIDLLCSIFVRCLEAVYLLSGSTRASVNLSDLELVL